MAAISWKTATSGVWSQAANWSSGTVPGAGDDVTIAVSGAYTVTVSSAEAAHSLTLNDGSAELLLDAPITIGTAFSVVAGTVAIGSGQTQTLSGPVNFGQTGQYGPLLIGPGSISTGGTTTLATQTAGYVDLYLGGGITWTNTGTVNDGGVIDLGVTAGDYATLVNQAGATFNLTDDVADIVPYTSNDAASFVNAGKLAKTGGTATSAITATTTNTGTIAVTSGIMEFDGGGSFGGVLSGAGTVAFGAGVSTLTGSATAAVLVDGATLVGTTASKISGQFSATTGVIEIDSGQTFTLGGAVSFGSVNTYGPTLLGPGALTTTATTTLATQTSTYVDVYLGGGLTWSNAGTVNDGGRIDIGTVANDSASVVNQAGATFNLTDDLAGIYPYTTNDTATFANAGTLAKTAGTGTSAIVAALTNTGIISAVSGVLEFDAGGSFGGSIVGAGTVAFGAGTSTLTGSATATLLVDGGTLVGTTGANVSGAFLATSGLIEVGTGQTFTLGGPTTFGRVNAYGPTVGRQGTLNTTSTTTLATQTSSYVDLYLTGGVTWSNSGTVNDGGQIDIGTRANDTAVLVNQAGATFNLTNDVADIVRYTSGDTSTFSNAGTLAKTAGTGISVITSTLSNTGTISVASGIMEFDGGGSFGGTIVGAGTVAFGAGVSTLTGNATASLLVDGGTLVGTTAAKVTGPFAATSGKIKVGSGQILTLAGAASFGATNTTGATISGPGGLTTTGTTTLATQTSTYVDLYLSGGLTWTNGATVNDGGRIEFGTYAYDSAALVNKAGATFNLTDDLADIVPYTTGDTATFTNAGTLAKTAGTGTSQIFATLNNTGTISVASGTIEFDGGGSFGGTIAGAGTVAFGAGVSTLTGNATASLLVDGGTLVGNTASKVTGSFAATSGEIEVGSGQILTLAGAASFGATNTYGATVSGPGGLTTTGATTLATQTSTYVDLYLSDGVTWTNGATVNDGGRIAFGTYAYDSAALVNKAGATFNLNDDLAGIVPYTTGDTATFTNAGTLAKTAGTGTSQIYATLNNTGTISVATGTMEFDGGGKFGGTIVGAGTVAFAAGVSTLTGHDTAALLVDGGTLVGTTAAQVTGPFSATSGVILVDSGQVLTLKGTNAFGAVNGTGPTLYGPGGLTTTAVTTLATQTSTYVDLYLGGGATWTNSSKVNDGGRIDFGATSNDTAAFINKAGATFALTNDLASIVPYTTNDTATFNNAGTLAKTAGTGTSAISATMSNTGTISVTSGTLEFDGGGSFGGVISGTGMVAFGAGTSTLTGNASAGLLVDGGTLIGTTAAKVSGSFSATAGLIEVGNGQTFTLGGAISFGSVNRYGPTLSRTGVLTTTSTTTLATQTNTYVDLYLSGGVTWTNGGTVNDGGQIDIGVTSNDTAALVNKAGATFNLLNDFADIVPYTTNDTSTFNNAGTLVKTGGTGTSVIASTVTNTGTISVASGTIDLSGHLTNLSGSTITGGTYSAGSNATLQLANNVSIATDSAHIILQGAGSAIQSLNTTTNTETTIDSTLATINVPGSLALLGGRSFTAIASSGNLTDAGSITLGGGTLTATSVALDGTGTIAGFGKIVSTIEGSGTLDASGGTLDLTSASFAMVAGTSLLSGNTLRADGNATLQLPNNTTISTDDGTITLNGSGSVIESFNTITATQTTVDATLATIGTGGTLNVLSNRNFTIVANAGTFSDGGVLNLGGGTFTATRLTIASASDLAGFGAVQGPITDSGTIVASGGTLALKGQVGGTGTISAVSGATIDLNAGGALTEAISGAGKLELSGTTAYTTTGTIGIAALSLDAGATMSGKGLIGGSLIDSGTVIASGGTLGVAGAVSGAGTLSAGSGALLDLNGGGSFAGTLSGAGTIEIDASLTLNVGAHLSASTVIQNANVTLGSGVALTNAAGATYTIDAASGQTVTLSGSGSITNAGSLAASGAGEVDIGTTLINSASISTGPGRMAFLQQIQGSGTIGIGGGAVAEVLGGSTATQTLSFQAATGQLALASPLNFLGTIAGFTGSDTIDLLSAPATSLSFSGGKLQIDNGATMVADISFNGSYTTSNFTLGSDGNGGSLIGWHA